MRIQESDDELFQDGGRRGQQRERFKKTVVAPLRWEGAGLLQPEGKAGRTSGNITNCFSEQA